MTEIVSRSITLDSGLAPAILGIHDAHIRALKNHVKADIFARSNQITVNGPQPEVSRAVKAIRELQALARAEEPISPDTVRHVVGLVSQEGRPRGQEILTRRGRTIRPKTPGQLDYVNAIDSNTVVFGIGPAGTGKTYLAMAKAVEFLQNKTVHRIILTRPAVEAGEKLGFLPGTLSDKIDPYLRPLYDALQDMLGAEMLPKLMESGVLEVAPLAYMRGRTLNDAFVILDEAQNTTPMQMKMFLTRLGFGSTMVVTGDMTQVDLPRGQRSGLLVVKDILEGIPDIHFAQLGSSDVVRHQLVSRIVEAYDHYEEMGL